MDAEPTKAAEQAITPVREQQVDFYGDAVLAAQDTDGTIWVPMRPICDALGLAWSGQFERIKRHPVMGKATAVVRVTRTTATGGVPDMLALPLDLLNGWLFGINAERVKPALRDKIIRYQAECFRILWRAFYAEVLPILPLPEDLSPAERALILAEALTGLARSQLAQEQLLTQHDRRLAGVEERQQVMAEYLRPFIHQTQDRLTTLEIHIGTARLLSPGQAAEIAKAVRAVAGRLPVSTSGNPYQQVHSAMYDRFNIFGYENLPAARYDECMAWLRDWYEKLGGPPLAEQEALPGF